MEAISSAVTPRLIASFAAFSARVAPVCDVKKSHIIPVLFHPALELSIQPETEKYESPYYLTISSLLTPQSART